ncbi:MAG: efflux RND transporter periplasmic adaptor subunit [Thermonemataceae bacterium]
MKKKIIISISAVIIIALAAIKLYSNQKEVEEKVYKPKKDKKVLVKALPVSKKVLDKSFVYTGTFRPLREVMIVPQASGEIKGVYFNEGDRVAAGQLLAQIDNELFLAQRIAAEASFKNAKLNYKRYEKAAESEGISQMQVDEAWLQLKNAESQLKQLNKNIRLTSIVAPFTGTITLKDVELGATAGKEPIARITDLSQLKLEIAVPESEIMHFEKGATVEIKSDLLAAQTFQGKITYVADRADASHNYLVKVLLDAQQSKHFKAGMYGTAVLGKGLTKEAIIIPRTALLGSAKEPQVFTVKNNIASLKKIKVGRSNGQKIEVVEGLQAGEVVVVSGQINLADRTPVEVIQ